MKDPTFDGITHAEEIFFKSKFSELETKELIKKKLAIPYGYYDNSLGSDTLKYTKKRLFVCEYNLHCDIQLTDNRYRLKIYYTKEKIDWTSCLPVILFPLLGFLIGCTKILAHSSKTTIWIIALALFLFLFIGINRSFDTNPTNELRQACRNIKKELEAAVRLELEP